MKLTAKELEEKIAQAVVRATQGHKEDLEKQMAERAERTAKMNEALSRKHGLMTDSEKKDARQRRVGTFFRALAASAGHAGMAADYAKRWGSDEALIKALGESTIPGGGALVPDDMASDVVELLRARTVVRQMGAVPTPMPYGNLTLPYVASGSTAAYIGENQTSSSSDPSFGQIRMSAKKLVVTVPVSNELLVDSSPSADRIVMNDMVNAAATREDLAFIRGDGTANTPVGMRNLPNATAVASSGTTQQQVADDLGKAIQGLEDNNIKMIQPGWLMNPRSKGFLTRLLDGNGNRVYAGEMAGGTLEGFPFAVSTQIPRNLGTGSDESEVYLADFSTLMIGESTVQNMAVEVFPGGTYHDGSSLQSGIANDQTVMRLITRHDFAARHRGDEVYVITGVQWGA